MAWQEAVIGAELSGLRVTEVLVNVGDTVKRGQPLARIATESVLADLAQARASVAEAEAALVEAKANAERSKQLQSQGFISPQATIQVLTAEQTTGARLAAARARVQAEEVRLAQARIVAPDDGVISARTATVGSLTQPNQEMFRLIRGGRLEWRAEVTAAPSLHEDRTRHARDADHGQRRQASKARCAPSPRGRPGDAQRPGLRRPAGQQASRAPARSRAASSNSAAAAALTLPQSAVVLRDGFSYVFLVDADNKVAQSKVDVGRRVGDRIEIIAGLPPVGARRRDRRGLPRRRRHRARRRRRRDAGQVRAEVEATMAINVSSWSIRNPIPAVLLFVMLTLFGVVGFKAMKIQKFPDIDLPMVTVVASLPGASPAQMETEVARKIENSIATLQGLKHIYTKVQDGTATITVEFRLEKPTQEAVDDVRDAVSRIRSRPAGRPARSGDHQGEPDRRADPDLHGRLGSRMTTKRCPGSSTTR